LDTTAVVIADISGVIRFWSAGAERAFGHTVREAVGQTLDLIVPPDFRTAHWAGFRRAMASGSAGVEGKTSAFPVLEASGRIRNASGKLTLIRSGDGGVIGGMVIFG